MKIGKHRHHHNQNRDKNNNTNHKVHSSSSLSSAKSSEKKSVSEFDFTKVINKLEHQFNATNDNTDRKNRLDFPLKLYSMQQMEHNVDLVTHTYINEVKKKNGLFKIKFFFIMIYRYFNIRAKIQSLQNENLSLRTSIEEIEQLCEMSMLKIDMGVNLLQNEMKNTDNGESLCHEDIRLAIEAFKSVRDHLGLKLVKEQENKEQVVRKNNPILTDIDSIFLLETKKIKKKAKSSSVKAALNLNEKNNKAELVMSALNVAGDTFLSFNSRLILNRDLEGNDGLITNNIQESPQQQPIESRTTDEDDPSLDWMLPTTLSENKPDFSNEISNEKKALTLENYFENS